MKSAIETYEIKSFAFAVSVAALRCTQFPLRSSLTFVWVGALTQIVRGSDNST